MEADTNRKKKWKLKKINKCWFIDVSGKLTRMNILNDACDVQLEDNIVFADELVFQLEEENDGEITVTEIKDICLNVKISDDSDKETFVKSEQEESGATNNTNEDGSEKYRKDQGNENEKIAQDTDRIVQNRSSSAKFTLEEVVKSEKEETCAANKGDPEKYSNEQGYEIEDISQKTDRINQNKSSSENLTQVEEPDYLNSGEELRETDLNVGSEEYVRRKGKLRGFLERVKQIVKRKPQQKGEPLHEDISNTSKAFLPVNNEDKDNKEEDYDYTSFEPMKVQSASPDAVPGAKIVRALFDFDKFSDEEISFKKRDRMKLSGETLSDLGDTCDWCLAEHLTTGKKGYIPLAYVTENIHVLKAQSWWFDVSRQEATELLKMPGNGPGTFLVRPSKNEHGRITLCLLRQDLNVLHYRIKSEHGRLYFSENRTFSDIFELIYFYKCTAVLKSPAQKQNPFVYPRNWEVKKEYVVTTKSFQCGKYGEMFHGKFSNTFDVTIVTKFKLTDEKFLEETKLLNNIRQCKRFVRVLGVIVKPKPLTIVLGETVRSTLQQCLRTDGGKTVTFKILLEIAAEIADGMAFLEKENVIHRHLKAENVFVCNFNYVKIVHPKLSEMMKVRYSDEHGKDETDWQWTAPEATNDDTMFSTQSDVWSFGVLLYEIITFGKLPYADLNKKDTLCRLHEGFRLSKPKDGPVPCPVAIYVTILKCWHRLPECRPTFHFLEHFLHDFEVAVEYEIGLKDANIQDLYMRGPLQKESPILDAHTKVNATSLTQPEAGIDPKKSEQQESTPSTSENEEITEPTAINDSNGSAKVKDGLSEKTLHNYEAEAGIDSQKSEPHQGTPSASENIEITEPSAFNDSNERAQIEDVFSVKALHNYEAEAGIDPQKSEPKESTLSASENIEITEPTAINDSNKSVESKDALSEKALHNYETEVGIDPQKSEPQESTLSTSENVKITEPSAINDSNGSAQVKDGLSVKALLNYEAEEGIDPQKSEPQESTPSTSENVEITEPTAVDYINEIAQIKVGLSVKALHNYEAEAGIDPQKSEPQESTPSTCKKIEITEPTAINDNNKSAQIKDGLSVKALHKYEAEAGIDPQKSESQDSTSSTCENVEITEPTAINNNNMNIQITCGFSVKALHNYEPEADDEIVMCQDDIITDVDQVDKDWWIGTSANGTRGRFPSNFVEIFEKAYEVGKK